MTTPFWVTDLPALFADFGLPLVLSDGTSTLAMLDDEETPVDDGTGTVLKRERLLWIKTGSLTLTRGLAVTFDGTSYTVRDARVDGDGAVTKVWVY